LILSGQISEGFILNDVNLITRFDQNWVFLEEFLDFGGSEALGFGENQAGE